MSEALPFALMKRTVFSEVVLIARFFSTHGEHDDDQWSHQQRTIQLAALPGFRLRTPWHFAEVAIR
jgi:hypothetical protein